MARAGMVQIQPGIESLSTNVLKLMRKGVAGPANLSLLRDAASLGLYVLWNILYGFPGEEVEDYSGLPELFEALEHLRPPEYCVPIVIDRFSPHHRNPTAFGIDSYLPYPGFAALFPPGAPVMSLAYHFVGQHTTALMSDGPTLARLHAAVDAWSEQWAPGRRAPILSALDIGDNAPVVIADTRRIAKRRMITLSPDGDQALRHFEKARREDSVDAAMQPHLELLLDHRFVVRHEGHLVSVVTRPPKRGPDAPMVQAPSALLTTR